MNGCKDCNRDEDKDDPDDRNEKFEDDYDMWVGYASSCENSLIVDTIRTLNS